MDFNTIGQKNVVDGKIVITEPIVVFTEGVSTIAQHVVTEEEAGRPDLISIYHYDTDKLTDLILKWNGISNPFSINAGEVIEIPSQTSVFKKFIKPVRPTGTSKKDKFISERRMTTKDIKRLEFIQTKATSYKNGSSAPLPPNMLKDGETNTKVVGVFRETNGPLNVEEQRKQ